MKKTLILSAALAMASLSNVALAADGTGAFLRGELGTSDVEAGNADDSDATFNLRGGYYFTKHVAIEGFVANLYDAELGIWDASLTGVGVGLAGKYNFGSDGNGLFISGRGGIARLRGEIGSDDEASTKGYLGVGAGYDFNDTFGLSLNYDRYQAEFGGLDVDADTLTVGAEVRF